MKDIKNVIAIGLGAIGTIYAAKLQQYDPNCVRVLVDKSRLERYQSNGILLNGVRQDFNYVLPEPDQEKADLIIIATKADALPDAINAIENFVHDETIILALLNGITSEGLIAERYGWNKVLHSYFIGHGSTRVGSAITFDGVGRIVFGEANVTGHPPKVEAVHRFFDRANIDYEIPDDILFSQWCKFMVNVAVNQASAIFRAGYGALRGSPKTYAIMLDLMGEAVAIAQKMGIHKADELLSWAENFIQNMPAPFKSSMLQDIEAGKKTEIDLFGATICALGEKYGVSTPTNEMFLNLIKALEETVSQA